jgi:uncharacterized protein (TIGR03435 family)
MSNLVKCPQCGATLPENAPAGLCPNCLMALNLKTETMFTDDAPPARPPLPPEQIAPHFPQLEIMECLGRGGMGVVYKARQKTLNRFVALKLLAPERVGDAKFAERFTREAQALAALNHPNIVTIHDFGQAGGFYYLLMEFVDGANLRQILRARKFTPEEALAVVPPLCDALQFAHERGIVHRDIKPENLLLDKTGRVKVADFGIAKMLGAENGGKGGAASAPENTTQNAVGTPGYSAPEQKVDPQRVDSRADIYSLGVVFYEMLTGELPGKKIEAPSKKVQIDVRLDEVVLRALEKTPELRWQTAADLRTRVETITQTAKPATQAPETVTPAHLSGMRWRILVWGLALAVASEPINLTFAIWGASLFIISAILALAFSDNLKALTVACRLVLIDGIIIALAAILLAYSSFDMPMPWIFTIIAGCLLGIGYCVSCWLKLNGLNANTKSSETGWQPRFTKFFFVQLPFTVGLMLIVFAFFLQPFRVQTDAAAPEIPRGSHFLVWRPGHRFVNGDIIAYQRENYVSLGRVAGHTENGFVLVNRNGEADFAVPPRDILGKVVSVYWRASDNALLRPTTDGQPSLFRANDSKVEAHAVPLGTLLAYAYGTPKFYIHWSNNRVILPPDVAGGNFDFVLESSGHPQEALQAEIKKQLGLIAHRELRDADVLSLLVLNPSVTALASAKGGNGSDTGAAPGRRQFEFSNMPIDDLSDFLEVSLGKPVINQTELTQKYSGSLKWDPQPDQAAELKEIQKLLAEQFGLELVPGRQSVEMLVVTKANQSPEANTAGAAPLDSPAEATKLVQEGWQLWQARKLTEAEGKFQKAVEMSPTNAEAWNGLGWAQFNAGKYDEGEKAFQQAVAMNPEQFAALNGLGQTYVTERRYDEAEKFLLQAAPRASAAWFGLARLYLLQGKFEAAEKWAQQIVDSGQADAVAQKMLEAAKAKHLSEGLRLMIEPPPAKPARTTLTPPRTVIHLADANTPGAAPLEITSSSVDLDLKNRTLTATGPVDIKYRQTANHARELGLLGAWMELRMFMPDQYWNLVVNKDPNCQSFNRVFPYPGPAQVAVRMCIGDSNDLETTWYWEKKPDTDTLKSAEADLQQLRKEAGDFYQLVSADGPAPFQAFQRVARGKAPDTADYTNAIALIDKMTVQMTAVYIAQKQHDLKLAQNTALALAAMMHNYNELVRGSAYVIPHAEDMDKVAAALKAGDMEKAGALTEALDKNDGKSTDIGELKQKLQQEVEAAATDARTSPFRDTAKYLSPFTAVHFDTNDLNKVMVIYNGPEYQLMSIDDLPVADILDFCRRQYGRPPLVDAWAQKRFAEDLVLVLSDMKHPVNPDNTVNLTLVDPKTGQQKVVAYAPMTAKNRAAIFRDRTLINSNLLQSALKK